MSFTFKGRREVSMIRKSLIQLIFSGSYMKRWNDKLRPVELWEIDKQAHKMIVAWVLFLLNTENFSKEEKNKVAINIIEGGIFDYLYRLIITDIKPPVFYQIKANPTHYMRLTEWVLEQLEPQLKPLGNEFWNRFESYFFEEKENTLESAILETSHLYASYSEFKLIESLNFWDEEIKDIRNNFQKKLNKNSHLKGVQELLDEGFNPLKGFIDKCFQLRFQKRWSHVPRIPETSVLGHMFIIACYAYFFSLATGACLTLTINNFFTGLFHDLPELLTRDIISPVKRSDKRIANLIKDYERKELKDKIFDVLEKSGYKKISEELKYLLGIDAGSEFTSTVIEDKRIKIVDHLQLMEKFNKDEFNPKDGELIKVCDNIAAFVEAYTALKNGINSDQLHQAIWRIKEEYKNFALFKNLHIGSLLADFD